MDFAATRRIDPPGLPEMSDFHALAQQLLRLLGEEGSDDLLTLCWALSSG